MAELVTAERVHELIALPKRIVRPRDFAWRPLKPPAGDGLPPGGDHKHHRIIRFKLISENGREAFEIIATSNGKFSIHLRWRDVLLSRLCCSSYHNIPKKLGGGRVRGPHIHYHRPGFGDAYVEPTDRFTHDDVIAALRFFMEMCGVVMPPAIQETLDLR